MPDEKRGYIRVNELMKDAKYTSIREEVRKELMKDKEYQGPVPFSQTQLGRQMSIWSELANKVM